MRQTSVSLPASFKAGFMAQRTESSKNSNSINLAKDRAFNIKSNKEHRTPPKLVSQVQRKAILRWKVTSEAAVLYLYATSITDLYTVCPAYLCTLPCRNHKPSMFTTSYFRLPLRPIHSFSYQRPQNPSFATLKPPKHCPTPHHTTLYHTKPPQPPFLEEMVRTP